MDPYGIVCEIELLKGFEPESEEQFQFDGCYNGLERVWPLDTWTGTGSIRIFRSDKHLCPVQK